uniref:HECT, UBA and WWE domain containing E3 ubiquitin protein ligase 1 n=1 Tax=Hucho hucho TaxID=62062 RepID=A0A4W5NRB2_9TELE
MKVDRSKLKKTPTEAPADCRTLIEKLKGCRDEQLLLELQHIKTWNIGKCELYHWVDLLDRFDGILCDAGQTVENMSWLLVCDRPDNGQLKALLLAVLNFTALLIEYSFSRHLYSSIEHLTTLLASCDMQVVLSVLNLLYVFSKRSNYITRLGSDKRTPLLARLQHLAESWGGKENGFGLAECCRDLPMTKYPPSATTLHFEFYAEPGPEVKVERKTSSNTLHYIHIEQLDKISESPSEIMESLTVMYNIPKDKQTLLFTHIRLAHGFSNHKKRLQAVQARLHAISILVYSNALQESANSILYNGLIEELVDVLQITDKQLVDIKAASLRTLTSIVHLERTPKLSNIIDCTGTASYHGFLPVLVRNCIQAMIDPLMEPYPHQFATALFSFLYHLASYDAGGEALVSCGMMEALLKVIKFLGDEQDQITFVTRAVRVVDLITNLDMAAFQSHTGLTIFISRLEHEVDLSRKECPFVIKPKIQRPNSTVESEDMDTDVDGVQCIPQRAALLKSMLNFLKKAIQDPAFSDGIRHVMDGSLPTSLKHIISNAEYYGPSLFLLATEVVTVFVFQEPSLLSSLQDNGLTDVMLHALLIKDVPATREVLGSLPNVFSALCLNARGLHSFVQCQPFERLFKVLLSPDYLPAMRRRRSSDPLGDTASNLGSAVDELMRHQPTLKTDATTAIIKLLEEICNLGRAPEYICQKPSIQKTDGTVTAPPARSSHAAEEASSEDEEEEEALHTFTQQQGEPESNRQVVGTEERIPIPLMDYILNVMKFVESILSNNTTDDHCQEFVNQKGLLPLVSILGLPNLPIDFPTSAACQAVAGVCKSILVRPDTGDMELGWEVCGYDRRCVSDVCSHGCDVSALSLSPSRLTFFICSVGFTSPMLFDERKYPYHLMLQKFFCSGGHNALFETFNWALSMGGKVPVSEGLEHAELPDGTGEFLDAWLMLVEKMVNPSTVLDSPHSLPVKVPGVTPTTPQFSALRFLIVTQKAAFSCICSLWNRKPLKVYGGRMAESMLAILCHILRGEPVIQAQGGGRERQPNVNQQQLQQLMDMGFSREHAMEALVNTSTMEQATEYLLTHPPPLLSGAVRDMTMSEEDQMMRAIAMSLGQEVSMEQRSDSPEEAARHREEDDRRARERTEEEEARCLERFLEAEPLDSTELHTFTDSMLPGCFHLLDELPDTVYRLCDLLMTAIKRSGPEYRDLILRQVVNQVRLIPTSQRLGEVKIASFDMHVITIVSPCLFCLGNLLSQKIKYCISPLILSSPHPLHCLQYLQPNGNNWRWFDDRSGRWCSYSASNNGTIDSAWRAGESSVRFTAGRRRYTVQFNTMVQVNEETGNRRPVMLTVQRVPHVPKPMGKTFKKADIEYPFEHGEVINYTLDSVNTPTPLDPTSERTGAGGAIVVQGLTEDMTTVLIRACVSMISVPVDPDTLHATLRLCLRLTRTHHYAMMFAELKSTRMILGLTQGSGFNGFTPLVTLLFRHIIEDPATLRHTMEKVVRSAVTSGAGSTTSGVVSGSLGSREINYILRVLGPAACRNPDCFADTANSCVRIALPAPRGAGTASDDEFENLRIKGPNAVQLVKTTPLKLSPLPPIPDTIKEVIYDMLNALATYHRPEEPAVAVPGGQDLCQILQDDDVYQQYRLTRQGSDFDSQSAFHINAQVFTADGAVADSSQTGTPQGEASTPEEMREEKKEVEGENGASSEEGKGAKAKASKPLMPTSTILRLLAELVRSYVGIATLIASYCYTAGQSELIKEDCSVLAFVLDHLLPHTQSSEDKDTPALARLFLASLAAAGTGTDAQVALVNEVKAALSRALAMAEGTEKHARCAVMCIISTIMESCPSTSSFYSTAAAKTQHNGMNNIIRLFLKKGLVNDLARVPHSLDLSSPNMANTVNAALKPLETLSRIVNQPSSLFGGKGGSSKNKAEHDTVGAARDSNSNTQGDSGEVEGTLVEGSHRVPGTDSDLMDGETEGDTVVIAGQPEVLSTTAMQVENELVDLIDELLERDAGAVNSSIIVGRGSGEDESQEDVLMDEAPSNISQASTLQTNREDSMNILEPEDEEHTQEEDSSGSNDDEDSQDEEEEEEEEEEEDQDDEGDEDDDDEGSEMELDEDFPDINAAPHIRFERFDRDDDLIIEFDNMFSTTADIPPSPGNIPSSHPLMVRHADHGSLTLGGAGANNRLAQGMGRSQRTLRQLTANTGHTIHVHYPGNRQPNPPLILQRLLGPSAAADILQLSSSLPLQSRGRARLLVGNEDVHIIARSDDELLDDFFHEQSSTGGQAGWTLTVHQSTHTQYTPPLYFSLSFPVVKVPILQHLETLRDEELEERREKRRRQLAEEEEAKQNDRRTEGGEEAREQSLQGSGLGTVNGAAGETTAALHFYSRPSLCPGISLPEGVDPSFLAALPEDIRREVLQNQLGIRPPARPPASSTLPSTTTPVLGGGPGVTEVSPEFLAALPPAIQEEVLAQQRAEQQRRELSQQPTQGDTPLDPVTFIQTLPSELRRSVLEDMEDSVLAVMPPDIAAEAAALRREQEARQRQLMHERLFGHSSSSALSAILRSPAFTSRLGGNRGVQYTRLAVQRGGTFQMGGGANHSRPSSSSVDSLLRLRGRLLLDHEALSCLLVLLFVDEPKLNTSRLHRVLRNLCYHSQTRGWVIRSLLSILQRSSESEVCVETTRLEDARATAASSLSSSSSSSLELINRVESRSSSQLSWLSVSMDAALGCRTNIFQIQRASGRKHGVTAGVTCAGGGGSTVHIHPQAAPVVCRHVLDTLIQLAKVGDSLVLDTLIQLAKVGDSLHRATVLCVESDTKLASTGLTEKQLQLSVEVLTSHSCSEEGLEDAANILLQLSRGDGATRDTVLRLLLSGARHLGYTLCKQIGYVVIVAAQKRTLGGRELQLPCMSSLTSKTSTQKFFLRVLQVIIQLREDTRRANKKAKQTGRLGSTSLGSASSIQAAVRQLEAEADAIIQMVREGQRARRLQQAPPPSVGSVSEPQAVQRDDSPMDVDQPSPLEQDPAPLDEEGNSQSETEERLPDLPLLSEQLLLDELWDMLGECLKELEESHDQHAVLVLQPAVEAFFLVHATERESKPPVRDTRESQLSHIKDEPPPLSPAPLTPATPSSLDPFFSREPSSMHISSNLPPDTQKFLRFAETHRTVLNQILRQSTTHLADGPFAVLVDYIRILDFDVKRKYFRQELERLDEGLRKEDMAVHVRRDHVFEDSYRELHRKSPEDMKNRL